MAAYTKIADVPGDSQPFLSPSPNLGVCSEDRTRHKLKTTTAGSGIFGDAIKTLVCSGQGCPVNSIDALGVFVLSPYKPTV